MSFFQWDVINHISRTGSPTGNTSFMCVNVWLHDWVCAYVRVCVRVYACWGVLTHLGYPLHLGLRWAGSQPARRPGQPEEGLCRWNWPAGWEPQSGCPPLPAARSPPALRPRPAEQPWGAPGTHKIDIKHRSTASRPFWFTLQWNAVACFSNGRLFLSMEIFCQGKVPATHTPWQRRQPKVCGPDQSMHRLRWLRHFRGGWHRLQNKGEPNPPGPVNPRASIRDTCEGQTGEGRGGQEKVSEQTFSFVKC